MNETLFGSERTVHLGQLAAYQARQRGNVPFSRPRNVPSRSLRRAPLRQSHVILWRRVVQAGLPFALILEDDVEVCAAASLG